MHNPFSSSHPTPPESGSMRADQAPTDAVVELSAECLHNAIEPQPALAVRLRELGFRPGTRVQIGRTVAGGARSHRGHGPLRGGCAHAAPTRSHSSGGISDGT